MGIKGLMQLLHEEAPECFKETEKKNYMGRTIAIDASMQLYQMMVQVRGSGENGTGQLLTNEAGEVTSHILGMFYRTTNLLEKGIKPVFVFDGKPPTFKSGELEKRKAAKQKAEEELKQAETALREGDKDAAAEVTKAAKRTVRVTKEHNEDVKQLLKLMGVAVFDAPCEAEAQCAELCKKGKVWAVGTEDMDTLTFRTPILLRKLTMPDSQKLPVVELHYDRVLKGLNLTPDQFVDLCILCGCDYCPAIRGIGKKTALKLIREHGSLEKILENLDRKKYSVPEAMEQNLNEIRALFNTPEVVDGSTVEFKTEKMDVEALRKYLVDEKQFDLTRVNGTIKRILGSKAQTSQMRMDTFFKPKPGSSAGFNKRKASDGKGGKGKKPRGATRGRRR